MERLLKHLERIGERQFVDVYLVESGGKTKKRYIGGLMDGVRAIPLLDGRLVLVRQYRAIKEAWLLEYPGGGVDEKEPKAAARAELEEEAGYAAESMEHLATVENDPATTGVTHYYLARELTHVGPKREPGEEGMETVTLTPAAVLEQIMSGEIRDAQTLIATFLLKEHNPELFTQAP